MKTPREKAEELLGVPMGDQAETTVRLVATALSESHQKGLEEGMERMVENVKEQVKQKANPCEEEMAGEEFDPKCDCDSCESNRILESFLSSAISERDKSV